MYIAMFGELVSITVFLCVAFYLLPLYRYCHFCLPLHVRTEICHISFPSLMELEAEQNHRNHRNRARKVFGQSVTWPILPA